MLPPQIATDTVVRVRPVLVNVHGRDVPDWDAPRTVPDLPLPLCSVQPGPSSEFLENRTSVEVQWTVFASGVDLDVASFDGIVWRDTIYQIDGKPQEWRIAPLEHTVIALVDRTG